MQNKAEQDEAKKKAAAEPKKDPDAKPKTSEKPIPSEPKTVTIEGARQGPVTVEPPPDENEPPPVGSVERPPVKPDPKPVVVKAPLKVATRQPAPSADDDKAFE
jgi:hypothetical protein